MSIDEELQFILRGVVDVHVEAELRAKLEKSRATGAPLRIKLGCDPSAPDLHLGHTVVLSKLRQFQELGHHVIFLIGDFTARIGDPTGKSETRKPLDDDAVASNAKTYTEQVFKLLDRERTEVVYNSTWMSELGAAGLIQLAAKSTVARMLERDDFKKRFHEERAISIHEFLYPLVQAYDSVALRADVELGGTDQLFNLLMGRQLQRDYGQPSQIVLTMPLLEGIDANLVNGKIVGAKMSKSLGNYVGISDPPGEIYGKLMSVSDALMWRYFELLSSKSAEQIDALRQGHPMDAKHALAFELCACYQGEEAARNAQEAWKAQFSRREIPDELAEHRLALGDNGRLWIAHALVRSGLAASSSEARRLVKSGAVKKDGEVVQNDSEELEAGNYVFKVGKRGWGRLILE
ncbi:MAG: tyrosine--tRNA ligase [Myxococcota bacterium]|nr:tyrosine--tRNA ligase [Myxococcota bacterium]